MTEDVELTLSVGHVRLWIDRAGALLERHRAALNELNVDPVDWDTGDNVLSTWHGGGVAVRGCSDDAASDVLRLWRRGVRTAARGQSGFLLSGWVSGLVEALLVDPADPASALVSAAMSSREVIAAPEDGTFVSVADAIADYARTEGPTLIGGCVRAAVSATAATRHGRPVNRALATVDSGAAALLVIVCGFGDGGPATDSELTDLLRPGTLSRVEIESVARSLLRQGTDVEVLATAPGTQSQLAGLLADLAGIAHDVALLPGGATRRIHLHIAADDLSLVTSLLLRRGCQDVMPGLK